MIISETTDLEMLKRMQTAGVAHFKRCINPFDINDPDIPNPDFNLKKAAEIKVDLVAVELRIGELTN